MIPLPIETERLLIRPFEAPDADAMAEIYGDPEVMRHICLGVLDRERTTALLEEYRSANDEHGFSTWAVVEKESGTVVGDAGFGVYAPTREPENEPSLRVAERLGMRTVETIDVDGRPHLLLALERS